MRKHAVIETCYSESTGGIQLIAGYRHKLSSATIGEWNLWGPLREVVVGTPEGTLIPRFEPFLENAVDAQLVDLMKKHGGKLIKDVLPDYYAALAEESDALAKVYESHGVKTYIPRPVTPEEVDYSFGFGASNIFPCDVFWCDEAEAKATAPCAVNIDRKTVLLPRDAPRVCDAVSKRGFDVIDLEFSAHAKAGGGIRCTTGVIYREIE
jgi:N-dimethylarginine dimethylaminohydrolase